jgi:hypothetical protein
MMKSQWLGFLAILFSVTACAPVTYESTYRPPSGHTYVNNTYNQRGQTQAYLRPIQVTLYSDSTSTGFNFAPIHVVISDGEYVAIPVINRRGRSLRIFGHYHQGNLHFDANRKCQKVLGSSGYQYDRRWDKGYKYANVNAGHNYDFTGLRLAIRSVPQSSNSRDTKIGDYKPSKNVKGKVVVTAKNPKVNKQTSKHKYLESRDKIKPIGSAKSKKLVRPNIIREVTKHNKLNRKVATTSKHSSTYSLKGQNRPTSKRSDDVNSQPVEYEPKSKQVEPQRKSTTKTAKINGKPQNARKGNRGSFSKNRKETQHSQNKVMSTPGLKQSNNNRGDKKEVPETFAVNRVKSKVKRAHGKKD